MKLTLPVVLFLIFMTLKLCGVIGWSWWLVAAPMWIPWAIIAALFIIGTIIACLAVMALFMVTLETVRDKCW